MTQKLFWDDPYQTACATQIETVSGDRVTLRETIFYAFSGGQESDSGTIGGYEVVAAEKNGLGIDYILPPDHGLSPGDRVVVCIDWDRRYGLMRNHFAAELILALAYQHLVGIPDAHKIVKIGAHISPDKARIDFFWPENISSWFPLLKDRAMDIVDRDVEIISAFSDRSKEQRYWEVPGFARVPCGGTHLKRTGEIGVVSLKRKNIGRGKERIEIYTSGN